MAKPRSIRVRYTLRALFVFITLFMLWGGYHAERGWRERRAEHVLLEHGAKLSSQPAKVEATLGNSAAAYQRVMGEHWGERFITSAYITSSMEPEVVDALAALPHLNDLIISPVRHAKPDLPDGALQRILAHCRLARLQLVFWHLTDADIGSIQREVSLRYLSVSGTDLSEDGLVRLIVLPQLETIDISGCQVTGRKLDGAHGSQSLVELNAGQAPLSVEFASFVSRSPRVQKLVLSHKSIDDKFIAALGAHPTMSLLLVLESNITDASVPALGRMPALTFLMEPSNKLTSEGVTRLRTARPNLEVMLKPP
jgi:hypothetical protein